MKRIILIFALLPILVDGYAQFNNDYVWNYYLMQQQNNATMDQCIQQIFNMFGNIDKEQKKNASVSAYIIPGGSTHHYSAFILLNYYSLNDVKIVYKNTNNESYLVNYSGCTVAYPFVFVPNFLKPGYTLKIYRKSDNIVLQEEKIPNLNSSSYSQFVNKTNENLSIATSLLGSGTNSIRLQQHQNLPLYVKLVREPENAELAMEQDIIEVLIIQVC